MSEVNQYQTPQSQVDQQGQQEFSQPKIFSVSVRIGRMRFLAYAMGAYLVVAIPLNLLGTFMVSLGSEAQVAALGFSGIATIVMLVLYFMFAIQRAHDMNSSGWLSLILLIPLIGFLIFIFVPGTKGPNRFDAPPPPNGVGVILLALIMPIIFFIGILAAIAIPAYQGYIEKAQQQQNEQQYEQQR